jgi:DNA polymerase-3 subunit epsilon
MLFFEIIVQTNLSMIGVIMQSINDLVNKLASRKSIAYDKFIDYISQIETFYDSPELEIELLISNGLPLKIKDDRVSLQTVQTFVENQTFCVVDIETNGSKPDSAQIIEIGAIKYHGGEIIDHYESLVYAKDIPENIQELTGITPVMVEDAPRLKVILEEFKIFLEDDVFVAHDTRFDYNFISKSMQRLDLGELQNRKLCTIDLAKRTIKADRYGLDHLKEILDIKEDNHHRAMSDAKSSVMILKETLKRLPNSVKTTEELIRFSKSKL